MPQDGVKSQEESEKNSSTENDNKRRSRSKRDMVVSEDEQNKPFQNKKFDSSEERIAQNMEIIADMNSVCDVYKSKLEKTGKLPSEIFAGYFKDWENHLYSDELGDIDVQKSSVKSEARHEITSTKVASIEAIPDVIRCGKIIFSETKTNSDIQRIVVCALIKIGNTPYYMGVMLQRDNKFQRLYLHNVAIEEEASAQSQVYLLTTGTDESNENLFITTILQKALAVKYNRKKSIKNPSTESDNKRSSRSKRDEKSAAALEDAANNKNAAEGVLQSSAKTEVKEETRKFRGERDMSKSQLSDVQDNRSSRSGVTADMSESARFEKLSQSKIVVHDSVDYNNYNEQLTKLENISRKEDAEKVLIPFVTKSLSILNKEISTPALNFSFTFSKNNGLMESIEKQIRYGGDYESLAKAFINMDHILDSAVLIEVHSDKYKGTVRENEHLENVYVLLSAYKDGSRIVPVQLEIKKQNIKNANILYINVALTKIETDVLESKSNDKIMPNVNSLISVSKYSISNIFANVNTVDKHFLKYV